MWAVSVGGSQVRKVRERQRHGCVTVCWNSTLLAGSHYFQHPFSTWLQPDMQDSRKINKSEANCFLMNDKEITVTWVSALSAFSLPSILIQKKPTWYNPGWSDSPVREERRGNAPLCPDEANPKFTASPCVFLSHAWRFIQRPKLIHSQNHTWWIGSTSSCRQDYKLLNVHERETLKMLTKGEPNLSLSKHTIHFKSDNSFC